MMEEDSDSNIYTYRYDACYSYNLSMLSNMSSIPPTNFPLTLSIITHTITHIKQVKDPRNGFTRTIPLS